MPVFVAFAAFMLLLFGQRIGLSLAPWVVTGGPFAQKRKTPGQKSGVRTAMLEMVFDHDSGRMEGKCLRGRFAERALSALSCNELFELLQELRANDAQGVLLLEAYLDRQFQGWREGSANQSKREKSHEQREQSRTWHDRRHGMTATEAYEVLGLKAGATQAEVRAAHRKLMMKFHPDQGGSTYFAARINEAKEILLAP
jgi:DnaJ domain